MRYDICKLLRENPYPGRGIMVGNSLDGERLIIVYFIMGRSENSRNRIFEKTNDGIRTAAFDPSKMTDPSLIIYHPVRTYNNVTIVTNGDQTDTILNSIWESNFFHTALQTREFEPDAPNYTPRISAVTMPNGSYMISILKALEGNPNVCERYFYEYSKSTPGLGHFISTYKTDADPLPSFEGEPIPISIDNVEDLNDFTQNIWNSLNSENKVSLYVREQYIKTNDVKEIIVNVNEN